MADAELLQLFLRDDRAWRQWRQAHPEPGAADFREADLRGQQLQERFLTGVNLYRANLSGCNLRGAQLQGAYCHECNFDGADLSGAKLLEANLERASLNGCNLSGAILVDTILVDTSMVGANLSGARLERTRMVGTNLRNSCLTGARVYGIAAWDVNLDGTSQDNLVISRSWGHRADEPSPTLIADSLELAQFLYLMMSSEKLRHIIDTITSKVVLILGRFAEPHLAVLEAVRSKLRERGYLPVLFDFTQPANRDLTETVALLAHMARFIIADISAPRSVPHELATLVPHLRSVPVQPLLVEGEEPYAMFADLQRYPWVLRIRRYRAPPEAEFLTDAIAEAEAYRARA